MDNERIPSLAPLFVNDDFESYIPEVSLTKAVVVVKDDVRRAKDFAVTIEEVRRGGEYGQDED